jgi:hypothetical protein
MSASAARWSRSTACDIVRGCRCWLSVDKWLKTCFGAAGYHAPAKKAKEQLTFDSDDDEDGRKSDSDGDGDEGGEDSSSLSLDEHIEHILRKTRTIALLKIANNTAEIVSPDDEIEEEDDEFEGDYCETIEEDEDDEKQEEAKSVGPRTGSFRKLASMRKPSGVFHLEETEESAAAQRLARKLSTYLCLPRVISYRDLEAVRIRAWTPCAGGS